MLHGSGLPGLPQQHLSPSFAVKDSNLYPTGLEVTDEEHCGSSHRPRCLSWRVELYHSPTILSHKGQLIFVSPLRVTSKRLKSEGFCDGALETHDQMKLAFPDEGAVKNLLDDIDD